MSRPRLRALWTRTGPVRKPRGPTLCPHGDASRVVLSHDPRSADFLHHYRPALILSGHTHGGQIYFKKLTPFLSRKAGAKYLSGFFDVHGSVLYVTRGIGASVPVRFRAPREVAHLTLRSSPAIQSE